MSCPTAAARKVLFVLLLAALSLQADEQAMGQLPRETAAGLDGSKQEYYERPVRSSAIMEHESPVEAYSSLPELWHGSTEIPLEIQGYDQALTQHYIRQYSSKGGLTWLQTVLKRGEPYFSFIVNTIEDLGLPLELAYLPVIESAFVNTAVSKSGAAGLWQFMKNSITPFGIRVDDWMDERMDFLKSTEGALRKLQENYNYFKDWPLALAAYNAGLGAVNRAIKQAGRADYWYLCEKKHLRAETIHYVPKFLAIVELASHPGCYGLDTGWPKEYGWERIHVGRTVDLGILATEAGLDPSSLRRTNQELRYGVTPPYPDYSLKVLKEDAPAVRATLERRDVPLLEYYFHVIRTGDTLSALARHYGVTVDLIENANPGVQARYLRLGSRILIPALKEVGPYEGVRKHDSIPVFEGTHLVKKGETLWSLALAYEIDPESLALANGLELDSILREGRTIKTPVLKEVN